MDKETLDFIHYLPNLRKTAPTHFRGGPSDVCLACSRSPSSESFPFAQPWRDF